MHKKRAVIFLLLFIIITGFISIYYILDSGIPNTLSIVKGNDLSFYLYFPYLYIQGDQNDKLMINGKTINNDYIKVDTETPLKVTGNEIGKSSLNFKLFGIIPVRTLQVNILPEIKVFPGGQAIGVLLRSKGVMVVGSSFVETRNGHCYPGRDAGIEVGDIILEINGKKIDDKMILSEMIQKYSQQNKKIFMKVKKKNGNLEQVEVTPMKNIQGHYMIGLYVDDGVSGVGTLTFYEPESGIYGALGHIVTEAQNQIKIDVRKGEIVQAQISGINTGKQGIPGEKKGHFFIQKNILGDITKNTRYGIYGSLKTRPAKNPFFDSPIPVATINQVKKGPAKIYTVINGGKIEEFDIEIERIYNQTVPDSKGMVIKITDPKLRKMTGGIIQGMSGSPIVQGNKLVGAVTHVFINNPVKGYGVFAQWMLIQTEMVEYLRNKKAANY